MAHGYLHHFASKKATIYSAGIETHGVNPRAISIMKEDGIDISTHTSNHIDEYLHIPFDLILTVCDHASEGCPIFPGNARRVHHNFNDPAKAIGTQEEIMAEFKRVREEIKEFCRLLGI